MFDCDLLTPCVGRSLMTLSTCQHVFKWYLQCSISLSHEIFDGSSSNETIEQQTLKCTQSTAGLWSETCNYFVNIECCNHHQPPLSQLTPNTCRPHFSNYNDGLLSGKPVCTSDKLIQYRSFLLQSLKCCF